MNIRYRYVLLILPILLFGVVSYAEEKKIILVEQAKRVSDREIRKAARSESEKNADGGYNANVNVIDCFAAMKYHYTGGRYVDEPIMFRMLSPEIVKPGKKYPLVIWFHGVGESGEDNTRQLSHVQSTLPYLAGKDKLDFFLIATQCPSDNRTWGTSISSEGKGDAPITIADEILETVMKEYPIDENKVSVFGLCSGGSAAWDFVAAHPGRFAAMAACSAAPGAYSIDAFRSTAVWSFNHRDDMPCEPVERFIQTMNASGGNAYISVRDVGGHDAWSNALSNEKVIGWMILQDLKKGGPPAGVVCYHRTPVRVFMLFGLPVVAILSAVAVPKLRRTKRDQPHET